ncbi:hypothetical protein B0T11DRAFT_290846, partial [Plectosphaerella cucumerina]
MLLRCRLRTGIVSRAAVMPGCQSARPPYAAQSRMARGRHPYVFVVISEEVAFAVRGKFNMQVRTLVARLTTQGPGPGGLPSAFSSPGCSLGCGCTNTSTSSSSSSG